MTDFATEIKVFEDYTKMMMAPHAGFALTCSYIQNYCKGLLSFIYEPLIEEFSKSDEPMHTKLGKIFFINIIKIKLI